MKAVLYVRVSSKEQEAGYSLDVQEREARRYAQQRDMEIIRIWRVSESAWKEEREAFNEMLEYVRKKDFVKAVIFDGVDRMTRNLGDVHLINNMVNETDKEVHFTRSGKVISKGSAPDDSFMMGIEAVTAKRYSDEISFKVKRSLVQKANQGIYPSIAPIGYLNAVESKGIQPDAIRATYVREIFMLASTGRHSLDEISNWAFEAGFRSKRGMRVTRSHIHRLLKNPIYAGYFYWKGEIYGGVHEPLISKDLFDQTQRALTRRFKTKSTRRSFLFQGLMTCANCGHAIVGELRKGKYTYYHCTRCRGTYIREEALDSQFADGFKSFHVTTAQLEMLREMIVTRRENAKQNEQHQLESLRARDQKLHGWVEGAYVDKLEGRITEDEWRSRTNKWKEERIQISGKIAETGRWSPEAIKRAETVLELLQLLPSLYLKQEMPQRRELLKSILSNCTLSDGRPCPTYRKPFDVLAEGLPHSDWRGGRDSNPRPPA